MRPSGAFMLHPHRKMGPHPTNMKTMGSGGDHGTMAGIFSGGDDLWKSLLKQGFHAAAPGHVQDQAYSAGASLN